MSYKIRYKLTSQNRTTYSGCKWTPGEWKETSGDGDLCGSGWLHCYSHPLVAVLFNPIHADIENPLLWRVEVDGKCKTDNGVKEGWTRMRLKEKAGLPIISTNAKVRSAILCYKRVCKDAALNAWADAWLSGGDRSTASAESVRSVAYSDALAVAWASEAAVWASVDAVRLAASFAARSMICAAVVLSNLNFVALAKRAIREEAALEADKR